MIVYLASVAELRRACTPYNREAGGCLRYRNEELGLNHQGALPVVSFRDDM
jgi:hypothetical protein